MSENLESLDRDALIAEIGYLRQRETFFNATQDLANLGYCDWDCDTDAIISCSPAYAKIFGMHVEEILESQASRSKYLTHVHPEDRDRCLESYRDGTGSHIPGTEYRIYRKDGAIRWVKDVAIFTQDNGQAGSRAIVVIQDITEHAFMREELEKSATKLKIAARTAKLGYWHFDEVSNQYLDISEEYAEIFGYSVDEFLAYYRSLDNDMELVHPDDREALLEAYDWADGRDDFDYRIQHRDGHWLYVREISTDILDAAGNYVEAIGTLQDISELKEAQLQAERANHAKTDFLSRMSHELRTPLNAILGFSQLIGYDKSLTSQQQTKAATIYKAGQHLLNLINEILDLSRLEAGVTDIVIEPVPLNSVIENSIVLVDDMASRSGISIDSSLSIPQDLMVEADATRLQQVLLNLLSNAVKYNRENGNIRITAIQDDQDRVSVGIADTGPGIAASKVGELFKPFNRLGAEFSEVEGTGIGLVITKQLVELMNGEIRVDSRPGEGSIFSIQIPVVNSKVAQLDVPVDITDSTSLHAVNSSLTGPRILVAEDNAVNRELLAAQLDSLGYQADYATTGVEALSRWKSGNYPLLLTDIRMPEMSGHELISQIRQLEPGQQRIPIIATSASTMESDVQQCMDSGADDLIAKPVSLEDLKQTLDKWLSTPTARIV